MKKLIIAVIVGLLLGAVVSKYLFVGSWLNLVLWGAAGVIIGWFTRSFRESLASGAVFGFVLAFSFMMAGYSGTMPVASRILPFSILGVVGAVCGIVLTIFGYWLSRRMRPREASPEL